MSDNVKAPKEGKDSKKQIREEVYAKLSEALSSYKNGSPEKEFSHSLKKVSKILARDFVKSEKKSGQKQAKTKKKTTVKKVKQEKE
ncbi:MAG TPA: hypothetical protein VMI35_13245 [Puia sp.]|nr:hypothetical protein [Puia sp.]